METAVQTRKLLGLAFALATAVAACTNDEDPTVTTCEPACDASACQACDTSGASPVCVQLCAGGAVCTAGRCEPPADAPTCDPGCGPCQQCDSSGGTPTCVDLCASGTTCEGGQCVLEPAPTCDPACGACQRCDTSGATPACVDNCGDGLICQDGQCMAPPAVTCDPACGPCETCDTSGAAPTCKSLCGDGATCDVESGTCVVGNFHAWLAQPGGRLAGPFANAYALTETCLTCHAAEAVEVMATSHWTWAGATPALVAPDGSALNPGNIGKGNLINNFCVGVPSNEKRCEQCHAGYGGDPDTTKPQKSARKYTSTDSSIALEARVDCLVCHASPASGYAKDPKNFGLPTAASDLVAAAQSVGKPTRSNCGACHFYAGGGDNVKIMGSALKSPTESVDVHMGRGMSCSECHASTGHEFRGAAVHVPTHTARASCTDCHTSTPHAATNLENGEYLDLHVASIACQTCHIPRFSRAQFAKMDWDWATAGDNTTCAGTPGTCTAGVVKTLVNDAGEPDPSSTSSVTTYDYIKGNFVWQRNVVPAYRWSNGGMTHTLTSDKVDYGALGTSASDAERVVLGEPLGTAADGKIMPFKLMRGRQAFYIDGAQSFAINPNVFGPGSFWATIQAPGFSYATYDYDGEGPIAPGQPSMDALWGKILAVGARAAGQTALAGDFAKYVPAAEATPATPGYDWRYTKLYLDINHEVAPKAMALGSTAGGGCGDCHSAEPKVPLCELYQGLTKPWGVVCP